MYETLFMWLCGIIDKTVVIKCAFCFENISSISNKFCGLSKIILLCFSFR